MVDTENYRKIALECALCKTRFEIWISTENYSAEVEEHLRKNFHTFCPVCKTLERLNRQKEFE